MQKPNRVPSLLPRWRYLRSALRPVHPLRTGPVSTSHLPRSRSVELQKANLEGGSGSAAGTAGNAPTGSGSASPLASAIPLAQLLSKSGALGALSSLSALGGLTDLLSGANASSSPPVQTTGVHRNHKSFNNRRQDDDSPAKPSKDRKYNPY